MQDAGVNEQDAERGEASWYLARDGKQIGPLSDRELSLFAEGDNFKPGDLLWTAGLENWKPAAEVFDLAAAPEPQDSTALDPDQDLAAQDHPSTSSAGKAGKKTETQTGAEADNDKSAAPQDTDRVTLSEALAASTEAESALASPSTPDAVFDDFGADDFSADDFGADDFGDEDFQLHDPQSDDPQQYALSEAHLDGDHLDGEAIDGEHVGALAKAIMGETDPPKLTFQERMAAKIKGFGGLFGYLWAVFILLTLHAFVGGAVGGLGVSFFLLSTLNAFLLTEAMPVLERRFLQGLQGKPLVYAVLYKTALFVTLLFVGYVVEMAIIGTLTGGGIGAGIGNLGGPMGIAVLWAIFLGALLPYFTFKEFETAVGADMVRKLFFGKR